jgi:putative copper export protein
LAAGVLALAAYNKFRLTPNLPDPDGRAVRALGLSMVLEIAFISVVLAVTAVMTTYTSPHS